MVKELAAVQELCRVSDRVLYCLEPMQPLAGEEQPNILRDRPESTKERKLQRFMGIQTCINKKLRITFFSKAGYQILFLLK